MIEPKVFEISCSVQNYLWGKKGISSKVAELSLSANSDFIVDPTNHYAELWMGTHPKGPSRYIDRDQPLDAFLSLYPEFIGASVTRRFGMRLPFLFKVLSVNTALSIQVHPDKETAELLHSQDPDHYPDDNHKPELAIALTEFHALCGFKEYRYIVASINETPELSEVIGAERVKALSAEAGEMETPHRPRRASNDEVATETAPLKACFEAIMTMDVTKVHLLLKSMVDRFSLEGKTEPLTVTDALFLRLYRQYPGDIGCFMAYFMNYVVLAPGEAMFLGAGLPHAYLEGDCMECMACSDNVVRAGLTPKFKDVEKLCSMLDYAPYKRSDLIFRPTSGVNVGITTFAPNVIDFAVDKIQLASDVTCFSLEAHTSGSICIVIEGQCRVTNYSIAEDKMRLKPGSTFYISANIDVLILPFKDAHEKSHDFIMYRAYCPL